MSLNLPRCTKVGSLCNIEPVVKASVISVRKDDDEVPLLLDHLVGDCPAVSRRESRERDVVRVLRRLEPTYC